jgi:hypothetical protein
MKSALTSFIAFYFVIGFNFCSSPRVNRAVGDTLGLPGKRVMVNEHRAAANPDHWEFRMGTDGRVVVYPKGWDYQMGTDGRIVAFPKEWVHGMGIDGRIVSYPGHWHYNMSVHGRIAAFPPEWNASKKCMRIGKRLYCNPFHYKFQKERCLE